MRLYTFDSSEDGLRLRLRGNPLVQWFIVVWIGSMLYTYLNPKAGFILLSFLHT